MFAYGVPVRTVVRLAVVESLIIGLLATAVGILLGVLILGWVINVSIEEVLPELGVIGSLSLGTVALAAIAGVGAMAAGAAADGPAPADGWTSPPRSASSSEGFRAGRSNWMVIDTGFTSQDAQSDFNRARRRAALGRLSSRLRGQAGDVSTLLPFEEVVDALGRTGERRIGLQSIPLDTIVGSVDRAEEFDRDFRPRSARVRARWQRINEAQRRGEGMPPIEVLRVGGLHFVVDGHHRVSVARHLGPRRHRGLRHRGDDPGRRRRAG